MKEKHSHLDTVPLKIKEQEIHKRLNYSPMMLCNVVSHVWLGSHTALLEVQEVAFLLA